MPVPDYQTAMLPFLTILGDRKVHAFREIIQLLIDHFKLTDTQLEETVSTGQRLFDNRVGWAGTFLKKAGLIDSASRANYQITERGCDALKENVGKIDLAYFRRYPEFLEFHDAKGQVQAPSSEPETPIQEEKRTPSEVLDQAYLRLRRELADELLQAVRKATPAFFEQLVVDVLVAMGYGGSRKDAGKAVGRSGDDGVDGIINEDRLGLDVVCIQAKRWTNPVGRPELQAFAGSLEGRRARKGVFIATSQFTKDAREYVQRVERNIVLIDGEQLAQFMIDCGVGVIDVVDYKVKKRDLDYFEE